jgi:predicted dehydrogenase
MLGRAVEAERHLVLATKFRHVPDVVRARDLVAAGDIGEVVTFEIVFSSVVDIGQRWNVRPAEAGGGVIIDNGCHAFDIVTFLFGPVARVHATRLKAGQAIAVEDTATLLVDAGQGVIGRIDLSWSIATHRESYITIRGTRGTIEIGWRGSQIRVGQGVPRPLGGGYDKHDAHRRMMTAFRDVVTAGHTPWITAREAMRTVAAVDAAYRSLGSGAWEGIDIPTVEDVGSVRSSNGLDHTAE